MGSGLFDSLSDWARSFGVALSVTHRRHLEAYVSELCTWQRKMNLTGLNSTDRIVRELVLDSLIPVPHISSTGKLLDLGSGAGFPAIPLKICLPGVTCHLMEPIAKKAAFLRQVIRTLGMRDIRVIEARIEHGGDLIGRESYDTVTTRAMASLPKIIEWSGPFLSATGTMVSFQGSSWKDAMERSCEVMKEQDLVLSKSISYSLPGRAGERIILFFSKKAGA